MPTHETCKAGNLFYMKKILSFAALAAAAAGLAGCRYQTEQLKTEIITDSENFALYEGSKDSLMTEITIEVPSGGVKDEVLKKMREDLTAAVFGEKHRSSDAAGALAMFKSDIAGQYREDNISLLKDMGYAGDIDGMENTEGAPMLTWQNIIEGHFMPQYGNLCSYVIYEYNFTGGAHGTDNETGLTFDLTTGEILSEEDIFREGYEEGLSKVLSTHLKDSFADSGDYDMLFVKEIAPNGNFYVTPEGITYLYGRYEIGPYVIGLVHVAVPWIEMTDLLK